MQKHKAVWDKYNRVIKVLVKPLKNPRAWLKNWTVVIKKAAAYDIVMADKPWTWIILFIRVIKHWKPNWESTYDTMYKDKIEKCTLLFKKVMSNFEKKFDKEEGEGRGRVAKGFFGLTFDGVRDDKDGIKKKHYP